jgi:hypothetical protein
MIRLAAQRNLRAAGFVLVSFVIDLPESKRVDK